MVVDRAVANLSMSQTEVTVGGSMQAWELALLVAVVGGTAAALLWPITSAWAKRIWGGPADRQLADRVQQLELEVDQLRKVEARVAELDQRIDFAERLLPRPKADEPRR